MSTLIAFDKSVRRYDQDGRLHVEITNISKANVCPYMGNEIPGGELLGLDPNRIYNLYRDPTELTRAASTFNNIPLLAKHVPVSADDHQPYHVVGATGTDTVFEFPYLRNSLVIWAKDAIEQVENKTKHEISSSYHYKPDMTPGVIDGEQYDGVMRDIKGNHVALVEDGRAGADVVVGDSATIHQVDAKMKLNAGNKPSPMALVAKGALIAYMQPKLAADAELDYKTVLLGTTAHNWSSAKKVIAERLKTATEGKLATDATMDDVNAFLDRLDGKEAEDESDPDAEDEDPDDDKDKAEDEEEDDKKEAKDADPDDDDKEAKDMGASPTMKPRDISKDKKAKDKAAKDKKAKDADCDEKKQGNDSMVTQQAMDEALSATISLVEKRMRQAEQDRRQAERDVRPYVGTLELAQDSAADIYRFALESMNVDLADVPPVAFKAILKALPKPSTEVAPRRVAMDAATASSFLERYPMAGRLKRA